jgi:hypothetical protein
MLEIWHRPMRTYIECVMAGAGSGEARHGEDDGDSEKEARRGEAPPETTTAVHFFHVFLVDATLATTYDLTIRFSMQEIDRLFHRSTMERISW